MRNKITLSQYAVSLYEALADGSNIEKKIKKFLAILAANNDLNKTGDIIKEFEKYDKKQRGVRDIEIISAKSLVKEARDEILEALKGEGKIEVKEIVNPDLLAGLVVISGDMMVDGSLRKKIRDLSHILS